MITPPRAAAARRPHARRARAAAVDLLTACASPPHRRLAALGVIVTETGFRWPGYISKTLDLKFSDIPGGALDSYAAVPALGWLQIVGFVVFLELAYGAQDPKKEPGDVGGVSWIRYDDPETKKFKLNAERNNGRAAMMGITGMMVHNALGVDALFPIVQ